MTEIIIGSAVLSMLHALLPNHWLPIIAVAREQNWTLNRTLGITFIAALAHSVSTVIIGMGLGYLGYSVHQAAQGWLERLGPILLILFGLFFLYQHHRHRHFHLPLGKWIKGRTSTSLILILALAMLLSPCLEIIGYYVYAGQYGWQAVLIVSLLYSVMTILGMIIWVWWLYPHVTRLDWHGLEHRSGMIAGVILILSGVIALLLHG